MGKILGKKLKRIGKILMEDYPKEFSESFEENKKAVKEHVPDLTRRMRNILAGFITLETKKRKYPKDFI